MERLVAIYRKTKGAGFVGAYAIRSLEGRVKYHLVFATKHQRGIILTSEIICTTEESYQVEVQEYQDSFTHQLDLFSPQPTEEQIFSDKVERLKEDIWASAKGKVLSRDKVYMSILSKWFGRIKGKHMNTALRFLKEDGRVYKIDGTVSDARSRFYFRE